MGAGPDSKTRTEVSPFGRKRSGYCSAILAAHFDRLFNLVASTASERLVHTIVHLGKKTGTVVATGFEISATNEELAAHANVSAFTVSRLLNRWTRTGAVKKSRRKVFVRSPEKLLRS